MSDFNLNVPETMRGALFAVVADFLILECARRYEPESWALSRMEFHYPEWERLAASLRDRLVDAYARQDLAAVHAALRAQVEAGRDAERYMVKNAERRGLL